jgi:predicted nucleotidyltransferase
MHAEIASKRNEIAELCRSYGVVRLEIFGSAARGTDFDPATSDVDVLVEYESPNDRWYFDRHFDLQDELAAALGREVDLISALPDNKYLLASVNESREIVYEA